MTSERFTRRRIVRISDAFWTSLLCDGTHRYVVTGGLAPDARAVGVRHDGAAISLVFESQSFGPVLDGDAIPEIDITLSEDP